VTSSSTTLNMSARNASVSFVLRPVALLGSGMAIQSQILPRQDWGGAMDTKTQEHTAENMVSRRLA